MKYYRTILNVQAVALDPDAEAFLTAAGITDATITNAINTLVLDLKDDGLWSKMTAVYPFVGGTASTHKWNLKDPRDLAAAYRLIFVGSPTHSSNGIQGNGINQYVNTFLTDNSLPLNDAHISIYSRTDIDGLFCDLGATTFSTGSNIFAKYNDTFYPRLQDQNNGIVNSDSSLGLVISNRVSSTEVRAYKNNILQVIPSTNTGRSTGAFTLMALNRTDFTIGLFSPRQYSFASIGNGLSDSDMANFTTVVDTFQTTLGRNV